MPTPINDAPPGNLTIRPCAPADRAGCARLFETVLRETFPADDPALYAHERFETHVAGEALWLAEMAGVTVGLVSLWRAPAFIHYLLVDRSSRGVGIGRALVRHVTDAIDGPVELKSRLDNPAARRFYEHLGWREVERVTGAPEPYARYRWR